MRKAKSIINAEMGNAYAVVNKLVEGDLDSPDFNLDRLSKAVYDKSDLPKQYRAQVMRVKKKLEWTAAALLELAPLSGMDERDRAASKLSDCCQSLHEILDDFPAHDWVKQALNEAFTRLYKLLNSDSFARPQDARIVLRVIALLDKVLK